ncbi:GNAT family N-acetyltransferase [Natronorarus salvus]|uniref:GNAT family N-acetyltransferase n=1 Tax=Natronorarus salvus TaxID=3117733 RepID=UPI002F2632D0
MYVRDARKHEEVWLLDRIEEMGLDGLAFRSRDYVIALDEETGERAGFGRTRLHKLDEEFCELTSLGVIEPWRGQGVGAHVIERLLDHASDDGFERVYAFVSTPEYFEGFGFERIDEAALPEGLRERLDRKRERTMPDAVPTAIETERFEMPARLRERFKEARPQGEGDEDEGAVNELAEEFGIDPESATYKYDTGR